MEPIFERHDLPTHLFDIPALSFHEDLLANRLGGLWFRLGAWTMRCLRSADGLESVVERQSLLLEPGFFSNIYEKLESVGNMLDGLGQPKQVTREAVGSKEYFYAPFYRFDMCFTPVSCEPLVFGHDLNGKTKLLVNPDLQLYFNLERKSTGIWWDPERRQEVLRRGDGENGNLHYIDIRTEYLLRYLKARQLSLLVGHYRHLHLYSPPEKSSRMFVQEDVVHGSPERGVKVTVQNWGLRNDGTGTQFLQRRLHLWFEIRPPHIDIDAPWHEEPPFDPYEFTLSTQCGPVAPARWKSFRQVEGRTFEGGEGDFMDRVYFSQQVLVKYEGASGFKVADDGSVSFRDQWGLVRSTWRLGNELVVTGVGDFAEGIPFDEWPHWKQYAVEPPSQQTIEALKDELTVPAAVNTLFDQLAELNQGFETFAHSMAIEISGQLWRGSPESLAGRQLKWIYPTIADDDEFVKRATLISTLVIDGLVPRSLRMVLQAWDSGLHQNAERKSLGSRKLLERVALIAVLIKNFQPTSSEIPILVTQAETRASRAADPDMHHELKRFSKKIRKELAPLAFLYDLRTHGGIAHPPNKEKVAAALAELALPQQDWHRNDYLRLLELVTASVRQVDEHLVAATDPHLGSLSQPAD